MKAVIFTHPPDYPLAEMATSALRELGVFVTWALDIGSAIPTADVPMVFTGTPRRGNLNGIEWVITQLQTMLDVAGDSEWVLKVDSDVLVLSLDWLLSVDQETSAVGIYSLSRPLYGGCYAIRTSILPILIQLAIERGPKGEDGEDLVVSELLDKADLSVFKHPVRATGGVVGFWKHDGIVGSEPPIDASLVEGRQIISFPRPILTRLGHERDEVIAAMKAVSKYAGIKPFSP